MPQPWFHITMEEATAALAQENRQYYIGRLEREQVMRHLDASGLEIGTTTYTEQSADTPHLHESSIEAIYVLSGEFHVRLIDDATTLTLGTGDFIALRPGTAYASKAAGARVLFVKAPGGDDKVALEVDAATRRWLAEPVAGDEPAELSQQDVIALYSVYQAEWEHRDQILWASSFRVLAVALLVALLPYLDRYFNVSLPNSPWLFFAASMLLTLYMLAISLAYGARLNAAGRTIEQLQDLLDPRLRRARVRDTGPVGQHFGRFRIALWTPFAMAAFLLAVNITVLVTRQA